MGFEFATAARVVFGAGALANVGKLAGELGKCALVVTGRSPERAAPLLARLRESGIEAHTFAVDGEPTIERIQEGVEAARAGGCDLLIGFGGGSSVDSAKAIAALVTNEGEPLDYLEVIGRGRALVNPPLPWIAIPTTAGTGSEVTRNAVLASKEHRVKVSLRSPLMLARVALVDPELTYGLPPAVTAATGMDALTQLIEPYTSVAAQPLTDALCREGIPRAARALRRVYAGGDLADPALQAAREDMALASLLGGMALANARLGGVHGFAGVLGGMYDAPHGAICACLLPHVMDANLNAMRQRDPHNRALPRYDEIARILTGDPDASAEDGIAWIRETNAIFAIPPLSAYGVEAAQFDDIVQKSAGSSSMKGNPLVLTQDELRAVLETAL